MSATCLAFPLAVRRVGPAALIGSLLMPLAALTAQAAPASEMASSSLDDRVQLTGHSLQSRMEARPTPRVSVTHHAAEPLATANEDSGSAGWYGRSAMAQQTMVWAKPFATRGVRFGLGVEQRSPSIGFSQNPYRNWRTGASSDAGVLVGVAMPTGPRSHVFLQTPLVEGQRPAYDDFNLSGREQRQVRVGMVFKSHKPYADIRKGLRMELSGQSSLTFKPRGGRVGVTFQKIW